MLCKIHCSIFAVTRFLAHPVGHDYNLFTMPKDHNQEDVIEVALEVLNDEQRKLVEDNRDAFVKLCLDSFNKTGAR